MSVGEQYLGLLRADQVKAWNAWRLSDLTARPRLADVALAGRSLPQVIFWRMCLTDCDLSGADLHDADLRESKLAGVSFAGADLRGAACWQSSFHDCDLSGALIEGANFEECEFRVCRLPRGLDPPPADPRYWVASPRRPRPPDCPDRVKAVVLLGDCTVYAGYLPASRRPCAVLAGLMGERAALVYDLSTDGDSVASMLARYDREVLSLPRAHVVLIRYGVTDRKEYGAERFVELLQILCRRLEEDFPGVRVVLETGMHVDYPQHYPFDRNAKLSPLYQRVRWLAGQRGYPLVDVYDELARRTGGGDWDWRIRGPGVGLPWSRHDARDDHLHRDDPDWFFNIHPNDRCIQLIAQLEKEAVDRALP